MNHEYPDPGDPAVVAAILERQRNLTRKEWLERLAWLPENYADTASGEKIRQQASPHLIPAVLLGFCVGWLLISAARAFDWSRLLDET